MAGSAWLGAVCMGLLAVTGMAAARGAEAAASLYVAHDGSDRWTGRLAKPNAARTDGPLATLEAARDAVRRLKASGKMPRGGVTVWLRAGVYPRNVPFELSAADGGDAARPVAYRAYRNEEVRIIGGREVTGWKPASDQAVLARLDAGARPHVLVADLKAQGITDYGQLTGRGFGRPEQPAALELFFEGKPMELARWPNGAWATIAGAPKGQEGGVFTYEGDRPARWAKDEDVWLHGYWTFDWADTYEKVKSIDPATRQIATEPPHGAYGYTPGKRYYALNILEELDSPGEWYLDRKAGLLYFWPPAPIEQGRPMVSVLEKPLVSLDGTGYVTLDGLIFEAGRASAVTVKNGTHNRIANCIVRNLGMNAIDVDGGTANGVAGCEIYNTGEGGINLSGGDRKTLAPAGNYVENCHIHDYSRWCKTYRAAIVINGVGNRVSHCFIHDAPHNAILLGGNDHMVEYNEVARVCTETGDAGAFYMGRDYTMRGNVVRYNFFHDLHGVQGQSGFTDVMGVYLDDCASGTLVYGNLFVRAGRAAMIGGGRDDVIENNLFVDCNPSVHVDARAKGWAKKYAEPGGDWGMQQKLADLHYNQPPYSTRYPALATMMENDPYEPKGSKVIRNISVGPRWIELQDGLNDQRIEIKDNLVDQDPRFVDRAKGDYRLRADSPALKLGFKPLPIGQMGLLKK